MDLDTNVKEFKYSTVKKVICLVLCLITCLLAVSTAVKTMVPIYYFDGLVKYEKSEGFQDSDLFINSLYRDVNSVYYTLSDLDIYKQTREYLESEKEKAVKHVFDEFKNNFEDAIYDEEMWGTPISYNSSKYDRTFNIYYETIASEFNEFFDAKKGRELIEKSPEAVMEYIGKQYDIFVNGECIYDIMLPDVLNYMSGKQSLQLYAKYKDYDINDINKASSFNVITPEETRQYNYYLIYDNGKLEVKGLSQKAADEIIDGNGNLDKLYLYFDFAQYDGMSTNEVILNGRYDKYYAMMEYYDEIVKNNERVYVNAALTVVFTVASLAFCIMYLKVTGKRNRYEKAKLIFTDYIPFELHLFINVLLGVAATGGLLPIVDEVTGISKLSLYIIILYAFIMWVLVADIISSLIRCLRSDREWYKFSIFYFFVWLGKKVKNSRLRAKIHSLVNLILTKSGNFKRNIIVLSIIYIAVNGLLSLFAVVSAFCDALGVALIMGLLFAAFNAFVLYHTVKYIAQLDRIISAARQHKELESQLDGLYNSLRLLAESMKYTNTELQNAVAKAVKDERLKTELITNVSHDLRTPLTSIISYVDLLGKCDIEDEKAKEYISVLDEKGAKLKRLIDDLIEASKVTSGNITINATSLNLGELCLQAVGENESDFEKAELDLIAKVDDNPPVIFADGQKAYRVFENLLSNARKYSARGSRVYVSTYKEGNMGVFEIKNISAQPLDISPDELTERFVRGDKSRNLEGNGLGLSIAKELCRAQNGNLEITIDGDLFKAKAKLPLA